MLICAVREALGELLEGWALTTWSGPVVRVNTAGEAERLAKTTRLGLALLEPGPAMFDLAKTIGQKCPVLFMADRAPLGWIRRALDSGAAAYLGPCATLAEIARAMQAVRKGQRAFSPSVARVVADIARGSRGLPALSEREQTVLQQLCEGLSTKEIARNLRLQPKTVEFVRSRLMMKTGTRRATELVRFACDEGFVDVQSRLAVAGRP